MRNHCRTLLLLTLMSFPFFAEASLLVSPQIIEPGRSPGLTAGPDGAPWLTYYANKQGLMLVSPDQSERFLSITPTGERTFASGLAQMRQGDFLYSLWRTKDKAGKTLWLSKTDMTTGESGSPVTVDTWTEALPALNLESNASGMFALWFGEHIDSSKEKKPGTGERPARLNKSADAFNLYLAHSPDHGKHFNRALKIAQGIQPAWIVEDRLVRVFSHSLIDGEQAFLMTVYDPVQQKLTPPVKIASAPNITPIYRAFSSAGRKFLVWLGQYGTSLSDFRLEGLRSDDGETWTPFTIPTPGNLDIAKLSLAVNEKGAITFVFSAEERNEANIVKKETIYFTHSADNGLNWTEAAPLRHVRGNVETRGANPDLGWGPDGTLVAVWEDWRNLSGEIMLNYSKDQGKTWQEQDFILASGKFPLNMYGGGNTLFASNSGLRLVFIERQDFGLRDGKWVVEDVSLDKLNAAPLQPETASEESLLHKVDKYWTHFLKEEWAESYPYNDPYYQARMGPMNYMRQRGRVKYHDFKVISVKIEGLVAKVEMDITYSIPQMLVGTKPFNKEKTTGHHTETWLCINGIWYREYISEEFLGKSFVPY